MTKDDGGLAFQGKRGEKVTIKNIDDTYYDTWETVMHPGMTLRDWFAGQALAGIAAHATSEEWSVGVVAQYCYDLADAMIAERNK
jgi:hypothetical protein